MGQGVCARAALRHLLLGDRKQERRNLGATARAGPVATHQSSMVVVSRGIHTVSPTEDQQKPSSHRAT